MPFWLEKPSSIFDNFILIPQPGMTEDERLNALTRLVIVVALVLYVLKIGSWVLFFVLGMILVIILYLRSKRYKQPHIVEYFHCPRQPKSRFRPRNIY